jgi:hypothetical protein
MKKVMKKLLFCLLFCFSFTTIVISQINLETSYSISTSYSGFSCLGLSLVTDGPGSFIPSKYILYSSNYNELNFSIYNLDHSFYKKSKLVLPQNENSISPQCAYINNDEKVEILVMAVSSYFLYNEDGSIIKDFGECGMNMFMDANGDYKLMCNYVTRDVDSIKVKYDIYTVKKKMSLLSEPIAFKNSVSPYPNPAKTTIVIPYNLKSGQLAILKIFNTNGQLVEEKKIDSVFDTLLLNVKNYNIGTYFYRYNNNTGKFIVSK